MEKSEPYWHTQIHKIMPDLEIRDFEMHQEGLVNDVLIVNHEWVFRFTKTEWGKELMALEDRLLTCLNARVTLPIPEPVARDEGMLVYRLIGGKSFQREIWSGLGEETQQHLADQLGQFLQELHGVERSELDWEIPPTLAPVTRETWLDIFQRITEKVYPVLLPHQIDWVEDLFEGALGELDFFDFQPAVTHGDLAPYHILYSPEKVSLNGVIDFGVAGLGDPATDLGSLINAYGESLILKLERTYPQLPSLIQRARFFARTIELQWVLLGIESGEKYWFTAHIGGARDIR